MEPVCVHMDLNTFLCTRVLLCVFSHVCTWPHTHMYAVSEYRHACVQTHLYLWRPPRGLTASALSSCSIPELQPREGSRVCDLPILSRHSLWLCL